MELIIWRHAEAEEGSPDMSRKLTARGRRQAARMAKWLNLRLPAPGQVEKARPEVVKTFGDAQIAEPAAVVLPKAQADLGA